MFYVLNKKDVLSYTHLNIFEKPKYIKIARDEQWIDLTAILMISLMAMEDDEYIIFLR